MLRTSRSGAAEKMHRYCRVLLKPCPLTSRTAPPLAGAVLRSIADQPDDHWKAPALPCTFCSPFQTESDAAHSGPPHADVAHRISDDESKTAGTDALYCCPSALHASLHWKEELPGAKPAPSTVTTVPSALPPAGWKPPQDAMKL